VGREEPHCGQVDRRFCEHVEDHGKPAGGSGGLDPIIGLVLGEPQGVPAIDEERRVALAEVHIACVQFGQVGDDVRRRVTLAGDKAFQPRHELGVGEASQGNEDVILHTCL
jgi:hypothetical protein